MATPSQSDEMPSAGDQPAVGGLSFSDVLVLAYALSGDEPELAVRHADEVLAILDERRRPATRGWRLHGRGPDGGRDSGSEA